MTKKLIYKYERLDFDGVTAQNAIMFLQKFDSNAMLEYDYDDETYKIRTERLETDDEYSYRSGLEAKAAEKKRASDLKLLVELKAKYENTPN